MTWYWWIAIGITGALALIGLLYLVGLARELSREIGAALEWIDELEDW